MTGVEPATGSLGSCDATDLNAAEVVNSSMDTETGDDDNTPVCTSVCTSDATTDDAGRLRALADAIRGLTAGERETLRELLNE